jgi:hypothetical protein
MLCQQAELRTAFGSVAAAHTTAEAPLGTRRTVLVEKA